MKRSVLLADDDLTYRALMRDWLLSNEKFKLVGEAIDGHEAVTLTLTLQPDLVLMDISMPLINGIEATRQIIKARPNTWVIGMSIHSDKQFANQMLAAGALAYIAKENIARDLDTVLKTLIDPPHPSGGS